MTIAGWAVLHAYDANGWYNRNLAIIANIERVFLQPDDDRNIHYFFLRHRKFQLLEHLRIHAFLGVGIGVLTLLYHFSVRVWPGLGAAGGKFEPQRSMPYMAAVLVLVAVAIFRRHYFAKHREFDEKSPGMAIPATKP